jgi:glycosyltransferase involved in cell wall biosynthesis
VTRVLHIIPTLDAGGAELQLALLAGGLRARGWDMHVCCLTRGGPRAQLLAEAGVPLHVIGKRWQADPLALWRLRRHIQKTAPDIVHTWLFAGNSYGRTVALSCGVPYVVASERCVDPWKHFYHFAIDRFLASYTTTMVTNSQGVVDFYAHHGIAREKFTVIPNGLPPPSEAPPVERSTLLASLNLPAEARLIVTVGRLWPQKRVKDCIWAFDLLQCVEDNLYLLIVGDGPQRARLERYNRQVTPNDHVRFLGERNDVAQLLPHCECFWLASGYEGQSNALLEALAAGVPVVVSDIPGNRELVEPEVSGRVFTVGDRAGLAARTRGLLQDAQLAQRLAAAGRERVTRQFSLSAMLSGYEELYRSIVGTASATVG